MKHDNMTREDYEVNNGTPRTSHNCNDVKLAIEIWSRKCKYSFQHAELQSRNVCKIALVKRLTKTPVQTDLSLSCRM